MTPLIGLNGAVSSEHTLADRPSRLKSMDFPLVDFVLRAVRCDRLWQARRSEFMDYPLPASQRRCHASGRDLQPGERYYGVVLNGTSGLTRHDFAAESWPGPPEKAIGFWSGVVPPSEGPRRMPINDDAIRESFLNLENDESPSRVNFRYVLALLMIRRKRMKLEGTDSDPVGPVLRLVDPKTGDRHQVRDPQLNEVELTSAQDEVFRVLGWNS